MKMLSRIYLYLVTFVLSGCGVMQNTNAQNSEATPLDIVDHIDQVEIDNLENIYILTVDDRILRYDSELELKFEFSNGTVGDIVSIDATNPQKILCFIADFNRILILDNTLAEIQTMDLSTTEYWDVPAISRSNDNRIWIFDPVNQVLVKVDNLGNPVFTSNRLSDYNLGEVSPTIIRERENIVVLVDESLGILVFDNFGKFLKLIPEMDVEYVQIFGKNIFYIKDGSLYNYDALRFENTKVQKVDSRFEKMKMTKKYTYLFGDRGLVRNDNK